MKNSLYTHLNIISMFMSAKRHQNNTFVGEQKVGNSG